MFVLCVCSETINNIVFVSGAFLFEELLAANVQKYTTNFIQKLYNFLDFFIPIYTTFCHQMYYFYTNLFSKYPKKVQLISKKCTTNVLLFRQNIQNTT